MAPVVNNRVKTNHSAQPIDADQAVSLRPSDFEQGGLADDIDAEVSSADFCIWDYQGNAPESLALRLILTTADGEQVEQYYSAGDLENFHPSEDGKRLIPLGKKRGLNNNTNAALFLTSLINAGFPEDTIASSIDGLEGLQAHFDRIPQPKRSGLAQREDDRPKTLLAVTRILSLPGEKKAFRVGAGKSTAAKGKPATAAQGKPAIAGKPANVGKTATTATRPRPAQPQAAPQEEEEGADDGLAAKATGALLEILGEQPEVPAKSVAQKVFQKLQAERDPDANDVVSYIFQNRDAFLSAGPWGFDGQTVSAGQ